MTVYYNEIDPFAAAWLRELIKAGHLPEGDVDERSISDVCPGDIAGYKQCHFFAGIGGWPYALQLAGWPTDRPVWTGSCPCQPFSVAGKRTGTSDKRHLWPEFYRLIEQCRPAIVFGEQVASNDALSWWDAVANDLENTDYACAAADLCAASVGAPHIRQRLYWVANSDFSGLERWAPVQCRYRQSSGKSGLASGVENSVQFGRGRRRDTDDPRETGEIQATRHGTPCRLADTAGKQAHKEQQRPAEAEGKWGADSLGGCCMASWPCPTNGHWRDADWLYCRDGKWRPVEPGTFPLAHGIPARVGRLRGYGNAIVPQVAAEFVKAVMEIL